LMERFRSRKRNWRLWDGGAGLKESRRKH